MNALSAILVRTVEHATTNPEVTNAHVVQNTQGETVRQVKALPFYIWTLGYYEQVVIT